MEGAAASQYWCHMCSRAVNPVVEADSIKCSICQSGFVEEMASAAPTPGNGNPLDFEFGGFDPDRALSLWAPILLGMMANPRPRRRTRHIESEEDENSNANANANDNDHHRHVNGEEDVNVNANANANANNNNHHQRVDGEEDVNVNANANANNINHHRNVDGEMELDRGLESMIRRRSSAAILQLLQGIRAGMEPESGDLEARERDRDRVTLINPFNQTIIVQGSYDPTSGSQNRAPIGSLGDYFVGPGLDLLMQYLSENDPNRYGTPPAHKEAVEALPNVEVKEPLQCCVCLEDCEIGTEVKEMPCHHKFHDSCILPWLELHSSCPICRYQLPYDEPKLDPQGSRNNNNNEESSNGGINRNDSGRQFTVSVPLPWPLSSLFPSESSTSAPSTTAREEEEDN